MMRRRYASFYYLRELHKKKVEKIEGEKILQRERERENRKKKMMEIIDRGMADISKILEEMLPSRKNDEKEKECEKEKKKKEIAEKILTNKSAFYQTQTQGKHLEPVTVSALRVPNENAKASRTVNWIKT